MDGKGRREERTEKEGGKKEQKRYEGRTKRKDGK